MKIIFTIGDCNGIGLEVFYKASLLFDKKIHANKNFEFFLAGNLNTIKNYFSHFNFPVRFDGNNLFIGKLENKIINCSKEVTVRFGKENRHSGRLAAEAIEFATNETIKQNYDAIVTLPISKKALNLAGWDYPGHTEMLGKLTNAPNPLMILLTGNIRVALATAHIPLSIVSTSITRKLIIEKSSVFFNSLKFDFGIPEPRIAVLGLNPHAGEQGKIGTEEKNIIRLAIKIQQNNGIYLSGPFPADGFFSHNDYLNYDGILAMYHDQGLIPLKMLAKDGGVNFTACLPIIRTSPDHGTAFSIAGKGIASGLSTLKAIETAIQVGNSRKLYIKKK